VPEPDEREVVYEGRVLGVSVERWGPARREIVERSPAVAIVATDAAGNLVLVRQLREAVRRVLVELPAGVIDGDEAPLETAQRELAEETGYRGGEWRAGPVYWATPGYSRERVHLFFAEGVEPGEAAGDPDEPVEVELWAGHEIEPRLGEVEDSKTLIGLLLLLRDRAH
jgi:ADP-ribose pyrophosphatase